MLYGALKNSCAGVQLVKGDEFACAMRDTYIAWAEDYGFRAERNHLRRFRAEGYRAGRVAGCLFQKTNKRRIRARLHSFVQPERSYLAGEIRIQAFLFFHGFA